MCCDDYGTEEEIVGECPDCGGDVDADGVSDVICGYSPVDCDTCGYAGCNGAC